MALAATTVWEIRQDGDDTNGGGYDDAYAGTDYTLQASPQVSVTDGATADGSTTTLTSATGGFAIGGNTNLIIGNIVHVYGGTNCEDGWYEIVDCTDTNSIVLDRTPSDGVGAMSGATVKVGGALATPGGLGAVFSSANTAIDGMIAFKKYSAMPYTMTDGTANTAGNHIDCNANSIADKRFSLIGYDTTRTTSNTDANRPLIDANGQTPSNGYWIELDGTTTDKGHLVANLIIDCDGNGGGITGDSQNVNNAVNVDVRNAGSTSFVKVHAIGCKALDGTGVGFQECYCMYCIADGCTGDGFYYNFEASNCIALNNGSEGFKSHTSYPLFINCTSYNNASDGFHFFNAHLGRAINCVSYSDGGYAFRTSADTVLINCASDGATSGRTLTTPVLDVNPVTLTEQPFTSATNGSEDFTPNTASGGGLSLRGVGLDVAGQTGAVDIGAVQHADPAGGAPRFGDMTGGLK